jgi:hypothetical protein
VKGAERERALSAFFFLSHHRSVAASEKRIKKRMADDACLLEAEELLARR